MCEYHDWYLQPQYKRVLWNETVSCYKHKVIILHFADPSAAALRLELRAGCWRCRVADDPTCFSALLYLRLAYKLTAVCAAASSQLSMLENFLPAQIKKNGGDITNNRLRRECTGRAASHHGAREKWEQINNKPSVLVSAFNCNAVERVDWRRQIWKKYLPHLFWEMSQILTAENKWCIARMKPCGLGVSM